VITRQLGVVLIYMILSLSASIELLSKPIGKWVTASGVSTHNRLGGGSGVAQVLEGWPHLSGVHGSHNRC
jgi:hypothetical protein